jgi:hypothetical protein
MKCLPFVAYAVEKEWLITDVADDEPPHSIYLTDEGRDFAEGREG